MRTYELISLFNSDFLLNWVAFGKPIILSREVAKTIDPLKMSVFNQHNSHFEIVSNYLMYEIYATTWGSRFINTMTVL